MKLLESLKKLTNIIDTLSINEDKGHLDHPEDLVFLQDIAGANKAVSSIISVVKNPKSITIKWDGYPALIFGRGPNGKFSIVDKHMFNKKDGTGRQIYSPEQFIKYDLDRGVERGGLHELIKQIWPGLEKEAKGKGYYWGDLLFSQPLTAQDGLYKFRANPNGITYTVDEDSDIGKLLSNKVAGIAVHQFLSPDAVSTDQAQPLNGTIGNLKNNSNVAIVPSAMPVTPNVKINAKLLNNAKSAIAKYSTVVDKLMNTAPQARNTFNQLFTTYINKKIVSGDLNNLIEDFMTYVEQRPMSVPMKKKIADHINANKDGLVGVFSIWTALYNLKMNVVDQLAKAAENSPVKGYLQSGKQSQEGFVSHGLKFVDRMGFSRQNLAGR
jgi:hypothetical protein